MRAETPKHFLGIEILRFLCTLAVVVSHYTGFFYALPGVLPDAFRKDAQPLYALLFPLYDHGNFAVSVFWAISGFIFFWKYAVPVHSGRVSGWTFAVNRISRLYPLHIATLLVMVVLQAGHFWGLGHFFVFPSNDAYHFFLNVFFISGWGFTKVFSFNAPIWSVSTEIFAYAVFFVVARCVRLDAGASALALVVTIGVYLMAIMNRTLALCLVLFFVGGVTFHLSVWLAGAEAAGRRRLAKGALAAAFAGMLVVLVGWETMEALLPRTTNMIIRNLILIPSMIIVFVNGSGYLRLSHWASAVTGLGNLTYSSYLVHFPLQAAAVLATDCLGYSRTLYSSPWALLAFVGVTFAIAHFVYVGFEMPKQNSIRRALTAPARTPSAEVR